MELIEKLKIHIETTPEGHKGMCVSLNKAEAESILAMAEENKTTCPNCNGDGFTIEHANHPHEGGSCDGMCPVQEQCDPCRGSGKIDKIKLLEEDNKRLREALEEAKLQLEYLNQKFPETGTTNAVLTRIETALRG